MAIPAVISAPFGLTEISRGADFNYAWFGAPIVAGDDVQLTMTSVVNAKTEVFNTANVGETSLKLLSSKLSTLPNGGATTFLQRQRVTNSGDFETEGGVITTRAKALNKTVNLKD